MRTEYGWEEIEHRLHRAMSLVLDNDSYLIEHGPSERAVAHRLAVYLEQEFPEWHVDCEYNRQGGDTSRKQVRLNGVLKNADPDIIVHRRGRVDRDGSGPGRNLLAVEVKPQDGDPKEIRHDMNKLLEYLDTHHYAFAVLVLYEIGGYGFKRIELATQPASDLKVPHLP